MNNKYTVIIIAAMFVFVTGTIMAQEKGPLNESEVAEAQTKEVVVKTVPNISVAIIDFESQASANADLGSQIGDILTARLSIYDQFQLVERKKLDDLLKEQQLNLSGMVATDEAVKVGKLVGARIMIFGKAFTIDKNIYIVAKIVSTETSKVKGVMAKGLLEGELSDVIDQVVDKLAEGLDKWAPQLLPKTEKYVNRVAALKERLKDQKLPSVSVSIPEMHVNRVTIDPAAETEIKHVLTAIGFKVIDAKKGNVGNSVGVTAPVADIIISGEGISEFGGRVGGLVSCKARLELQAVKRNSKVVIATERTTRTIIDLSEVLAAKTALQAAGHELAIRLAENIEKQIEKKNTVVPR